MPNTIYTYQPIDPIECMGDSLTKINNNNFLADGAIGTLETRIVAASANLNTRIIAASSSVITTLSTGIQQSPYTAKAWVNFNGLTGNINKAYNVTNVTRNSQGIYTITMPSGLLQDTNYIVSAHAGETDGDGPVTITLDSDTNLTTTTFRLNSYASSSVRADRPIIMAIVYGY